MFSHLVLIDKSPYFLYCKDEEDALSTAAKAGSHVVGIATGDEGGIIVRKPRSVMTLEQEEVKQIDCDDDLLEESKFLNSQNLIGEELGKLDAKPVQPQIEKKA